MYNKNKIVIEQLGQTEYIKILIIVSQSPAITTFTLYHFKQQLEKEDVENTLAVRYN